MPLDKNAILESLRQLEDSNPLVHSVFEVVRAKVQQKKPSEIFDIGVECARKIIQEGEKK